MQRDTSLDEAEAFMRSVEREHADPNVPVPDEIAREVCRLSTVARRIRTERAAMLRTRLRRWLMAGTVTACR